MKKRQEWPTGIANVKGTLESIETVCQYLGGNGSQDVKTEKVAVAG